MTELSPAAQAVLFAWDDVIGFPGDPTPTEQRALAAALRAAADQVVPEETTPWNSTLTPMVSAADVRSELLAIAAELNRTNPIEPKN